MLRHRLKTGDLANRSERNAVLIKPLTVKKCRMIKCFWLLTEMDRMTIN